MRLIDADALIQKRNHAKAYATDMYVIGQGYVMDAPTIDAVPVVRCKDCQYSKQGTIYPMRLYCYNTILTDNGFRTDEDDFCSYGKRTEVKE